MTSVQTLCWVGDSPGGYVEMVEQTLLPLDYELLAVRTVPQMVDAIYRLAVRGAPAIGVAAAYGLMLGVQDAGGESANEVLRRTEDCATTLAAARPTAVNLFWALDRMKARAARDAAAGANGAGIVSGLFEEAHAIYHSDQDTCRRMGDIGADLIADGNTLLTHCNAGALATAGMGTALAPIYRAHEQGKRVAVYADETRPLLQGARITSWELMQAGIDVTLIADTAMARVMSEGRIDAVFVGSDRNARDADVCNKVGTYAVALAAQAHYVPFYVVAPLSTVDPSLDSGELIPIEERPAEEVTCGFGKRTAPEGVRVYNPAFDVTPARLVRGIVTEVGLIEHPTMAKMEAALRAGGVEFQSRPRTTTP
ncbi:MAG: S-methyl-5-thioribose-1-phosphate isomerase [bacterium]|nr:S-methyl-5-thioribose-1-phosphate isomerase [bacterium]